MGFSDVFGGAGGGGATAEEIVAAIKADPDLGTDGLIADASTSATQSTEAVTQIAQVKAKTDIIGTIKALVRW